MNNSTQKFLFEEFIALCDEIMESLKESRQLERNALLASGAIWTRVIANKPQNVYQQLLLVPPLIALLSALRAWSLWKHLNHISKYIRTPKSFLSVLDNLGWGRVFAKSKDYLPEYSGFFLGPQRYLLQ